MIRNRDINGNSFNAFVKDKVWDKGIIIYENEKDQRRKDSCRNIIFYHRYGDTDSVFGWEIDHINPKANGGGDIIGNLQPLQWETNKDKSDKYPWKCGD